MTHTPTPWQTGLDGSVRDAKGNCIPLYSGFIAEAFYGEEPAISNAAFIVTAVNAYAPMKKALEAVRSNLLRLDWSENSVMIEGIDAALAAAKEQSA